MTHRAAHDDYDDYTRISRSILHSYAMPDPGDAYRDICITCYQSKRSRERSQPHSLGPAVKRSITNDVNPRALGQPGVRIHTREIRFVRKKNERDEDSWMIRGKIKKKKRKTTFIPLCIYHIVFFS